MCSDGITVGVCAIAVMTSSVKAAGCGEVNRTRSMPGTPPTARSRSANAVAVAELHAVGVDVLPQQGHLGRSGGHQGLDLGEDLRRPAVALLATQ